MKNLDVFTFIMIFEKIWNWQIVLFFEIILINLFFIYP